jgi:uncharacterized membrane protein YhaH (DUF805 family)
MLFTAITKYATFDGTADRKEYWGLILLGVILVVLSAFDPSGVLYAIVLLALVLPSLAVSARRLRSFNWNPWLTVLTIVPMVNVIMLLILGFKPATCDTPKVEEATEWS